MTKSQTIHIQMLGDSTTGIWVAEIEGSNLKALRIPKNLLQVAFKDRNELKQVGVYLPVSETDIVDTQGRVYIGKTGILDERLNNYFTKKEFWTEVIVFTRESNNLSSTHAEFLEAVLFDDLTSVNRYKIENSQKPRKSSVPDRDIAPLDDARQQIKALTAVLGHKMFVPLRGENTFSSIGDKPRQVEVPVFTLQIPKSSHIATMSWTNDGFVVHEGSYARKETANSTPQTSLNLRDSLMKAGKLSDEGDILIFKRDILFNSSSSAASVICGASTNGKTAWISDGKKLGEFDL